jgi:hypothetical protein
MFILTSRIAYNRDSPQPQPRRGLCGERPMRWDTGELRRRIREEDLPRSTYLLFVRRIYDEERALAGDKFGGWYDAQYEEPA